MTSTSGRLKTLCTLPPPHNTQRPNSKSLIGGIKSTLQHYYYFWHFFIVFFHCWYTAFSALFHSIFSLLFHSIFGAVSQYLLLLFQITIGTVSSFIPGRVTVQFYSRPFSSFIPSCVTVQLWRSRKLSASESFAQLV